MRLCMPCWSFWIAWSRSTMSCLGNLRTGSSRPDHISTALNLDLPDVQRYWPERISDSRSKNIFSGAGFKTVNFVAEIPLRLDHIVDGVQPAIAVVQTEVQLVDEETNRRNEEGENAHARYKSRQSEKVRERLEGLHSGLPQLPRLKD